MRFDYNRYICNMINVIYPNIPYFSIQLLNLSETIPEFRLRIEIRVVYHYDNMRI